MQCGPGPKTSTRRARETHLCLINQLRRESAGLLRSLALLWRGDSLWCPIVEQDGAWWGHRADAARAFDPRMPGAACGRGAGAAPVRRARIARPTSQSSRRNLEPDLARP